jgi:RNA polymerase sigma-70 factor (ECF subfamily)
MQTAIAALPSEQREVILLIALEQLSYSEVSKALDIPIGTVMSRLFRARERLRAQLAGATPQSNLKLVR